MDKCMLYYFCLLLAAIWQCGRVVYCESGDVHSNSSIHEAYDSTLDALNHSTNRTDDMQFEKKLRKKIFGAHSQSLPMYINSLGVDVYLSMQLLRMDEIGFKAIASKMALKIETEANRLSEKGQAITSKLILRQEWSNPTLRWKPSEFGNVSEILIGKEKIWTPQVHLFNGARKNKIDKDASKILESLMVTVSSDGNCTMTYADFYKSTCEIDVTYFPFDQQNCDLEFGSWNFDERYLRLKVKDPDALGDKSEYKNNGEWEIAKAVLYEHKVKYRLNDRHHRIVVLQLHVKRKYFFYMMNLVIPCALIACMIFLVFLLPPKSGERISLGITVLLSMAIFQELSSEKLPSSSDTFPLLGIYYTVSIFEIGMAMALNCLVLNFYHRNQRMSPLVRKILLGRLATFLRVEITPRKHSKDMPKEESFSEFDSSFAKAKGPSSINLGTISHMANENNTEVTLSRMGSMRGSLRERKSHDSDMEEGNGRSKSPLISRKAIKGLNDGGAIGNGVVNKDAVESNKNGEEWRDAAKVLDRLLLLLSIVIGVVSASAIFMQSERFRDMVLFRDSP